MLKIVVVIVAVVLALGVGILAYAATKPDTFRVQRTARVKAPPERIFPLIEAFDNWTAWSPYEKRDPAMKRTRSGAASGKGAVYAWDGNSQVGKGRMEITETVPASKIVIRLDFMKPFEAHNVAEFTFPTARRPTSPGRCTAPISISAR